MKNLSFLSILLLSFTFNIGCRKEVPDTNIEEIGGIAYQINSKTPIPNATLYLIKSVWSGEFLSGSANTTILDTVITNEKGEYRFKFQYEKSAKYYVRGVAEQHYNTTSYYVDRIRLDGHIYFTPFAWMAIRIINAPPVNSGDHIYVTNEIRDDFNDTGFVSFGSCDTIIIKKMFGNQKNRLFYRTMKDNITVKEVADSVYCRGLDTTFYSITY